MTAASDEHLNDLAVIGMDARLPGAPDLGRFWDNLRRGVESVESLSAAIVGETDVRTSEQSSYKDGLFEERWLAAQLGFSDAILPRCWQP